MNRIHFVLASIVLGFSANAYSANVSVYSNSSSYTAAVGSELFRIDFNGSPNMTVDGSTISTYAAFGSPEVSNTC